MKHAEFVIERQSPPVQAAVAFLRGGALAPDAVERSLELAGVLEQLLADDELLLTGLLVPASGSLPAHDERLREVFGEAPLRLASELERVADSGIPAGWNPGEALKPAQSEGLRKLLLSLASDVRLVLLRLAVQLVRLRHLKAAPDAEQQRAALETREIYAPLASRLGIWQVKWEGGDGATLMGWLIRIAENEVRDQVDYQHRQRRDVSAAVSIDAGGVDIAARVRSALSAAVVHEEAERLGAALANRSTRTIARLIVLLKLEELSFKEVAARMGRSEDACRMLLARAMVALTLQLRAMP